MATRFKPDEPVERQILAELYEVTEQLEAAIGEHAQVLQKDPLRVDPYRALYRLYLEEHDYDQAWCMCAALAFLRKADEEEQRFFEDYRPQGMIQVKSRLDNEQWVKNLFHEDENIYIGKIFEMIAPAALVAKIAAAREGEAAAGRSTSASSRIRRRRPSRSRRRSAGRRRCSASSCPELYVRNDVPGALVAVPSRPPASVAGQTRAHRLHAAGAHVHRRQAPRVLPRRALHQERSSRRWPS